MASATFLSEMSAFWCGANDTEKDGIEEACRSNHLCASGVPEKPFMFVNTASNTSAYSLLTVESVKSVNAKIIEDHALPGKVSHFPKQSALLERNIEQSGGKERCIQCHFEMKFAPGC